MKRTLLILLACSWIARAQAPPTQIDINLDTKNQLTITRIAPPASSANYVLGVDPTGFQVIKLPATVSGSDWLLPAALMTGGIAKISCPPGTSGRCWAFGVGSNSFGMVMGSAYGVVNWVTPPNLAIPNHSVWLNGTPDVNGLSLGDWLTFSGAFTFTGSGPTVLGLNATGVQTTACGDSGHVGVTTYQADGRAVTCTPTAISGGPGGGTTLSTPGVGSVLPFGIAADASGSTNGANISLIWQFTCCERGVSIQVKTVGIKSGVSPAGLFLAAAFYSDNSGACGTLLGQTAPVSVASAGVDYYPQFASSLTLVQGTTYWASLTGDTAGWSPRVISNDITILNETSHPRSGKAGNNSTLTGSSLAFAGSCGTIATGATTSFPVMVLFPG